MKSMSKLHVFGDSWATPPTKELVDDPNCPTPWMFLLFDKLGCEAIKSYAANGTSMDWVMHQFFEHGQDDIQKGDCIVWIVTHPSRRWLLEDHPELSNIWMNYDTCDAISPQERKALIQYRRYLNNKKSVNTHLKAMSIAMSHVAMSKGAKIIQVPGFVRTSPDAKAPTHEMLFNPFVKVTGALEVVGSYNFPKEYEIWERNKMQVDMVTETQIDNRFNHMSWDNHEIFANKLYESFVNRKDLDVDNGFSSDVQLETKEKWTSYNHDIIGHLRRID